MSRRWRLRLTVLLAVLAMIGAACGGDDDTGASTTAAPTTTSGGATTTSDGATTTTAAVTTTTSGGGRQQGGELVFAFPGDEDGDFLYLIPMAGNCRTFCNSILPTIFDPLIVQDPTTNELAGVLADSWSVSDDGLTWMITLKDATFHDGTPVTAEDVRFSLDLALDEQYLPNNSYPASLRANAEEVLVIDDKTVQINMSTTQANFAESVLGRSYFGIVPKHAFESMGYEAFGQNPIGSGPFIFDSWVPGEGVRVVRNPDYKWGPAFTETAGGPPSVDAIHFKYFVEPSTRLAAFEANEINAFDGIPEVDQARLVDDPNVTVIEVAKNGSPSNIEFNNEVGLTTELAVRQAIAYAIDREAYNQAVYAGVNEPICTLLEARMKFVNPDACIPTGDAAVAAQILDDAGWVMGGDGVRERDGVKLELTGLVQAEQSKELEFIQAQLAAVGIKLNVEPGSRSAINEQNQDPTSWNVFRGTLQGWTNEDPNILRAQFYTGLKPPDGTSNRSFYSNPAVDELLDAGLAETDNDRRREIYFEAQELIAADVPVVPLLSVRRNIAVASNVHGITPDARGTYRYFYDVWIEV